MRSAAALIGAALALGGCMAQKPRQSAGTPHYVVGRPYQIGGAWRYPREQFDDDETGLATTLARTEGVTADGEAVDPQAMAGAHPTLQLPAIVRVTNLDNGYQVVVRINDRGPADPGRVIALTPRAMALLRAADPHALRVRVEVLQAESLQLAADLGGAEAPHLALAVVPVGEVTTQPLPPPPGVAQAQRVRMAAASPKPRAAEPAALSLPLRLPETVTRTTPRPGSIYVEIAGFSHAGDAVLLRNRLASMGAEVVLDYSAPHDRAYRVRIGPLPGPAAADATLARVIAAGLGDARIIAQ
jgi:rare lipoprotein A